MITAIILDANGTARGRADRALDGSYTFASSNMTAPAALNQSVKISEMARALKWLAPLDEWDARFRAYVLHNVLPPQIPLDEFLALDKAALASEQIRRRVMGSPKATDIEAAKTRLLTLARAQARARGGSARCPLTYSRFIATACMGCPVADSGNLLQCRGEQAATAPPDMVAFRAQARGRIADLSRFLEDKPR